MRSRRRPPPRCEDNASARTPGRFIPSPRAIMRAPGRASQQAATLNCVRCIVRSPRTLDTAPGTSKLGVAEGVGIRSRVRWNAPTEGASPLVGSPRRGHIPFGTPVRIPHTRGIYPSPRAIMRAPGRASSVWRRGWDSNPRSSYPDSSFRDCPNRPLSHSPPPTPSPFAESSRIITHLHAVPQGRRRGALWLKGWDSCRGLS